MPNSVDEKVVQLTLENKQFTKGADESIDSLEKLKKTLEFEGAIESFDELDKGIKKVDFSPMQEGIESVSNSFSILDTVVDATIRNMTNRLIDSGEQMIKSLTTDQITTGWDKYAEKTGAVQTIMAATANQFEDTAEQMGVVNDQLSKLTWFTDETSHKFNDMVSGIGKFTANNVDLDTSVKAMEGIATWASLSGANANEASRAIYNLAQAVSVGAVKLVDWKSIENANMGTTEFKQTVIETAEELGTLTKVAEGTWQTLAGNTVTAANFSENLSYDKWFTSDVLLKALEKYGNFADRLNVFVEETGVLTATAMNYVDQYVDGTINMGEAMQATGLDAETLTEWLEELGSAENELGRRAFRASQETKTFAEAIDYVKEAVSSGWSTSFEYIFGDYTEAKEWWSEIAEVMYDCFVVGGEIRNQVLSIWKEWGGRETFLDGIRALIENVTGLLDIFKSAWREVWYGEDEEGQIKNQAKALLSLTDAFKAFADAIKPTEETAQNLHKILTTIFSVLKTGINILKTLGKGLTPILNLLNLIAGTLLTIFANVMSLLNAKLESIFTPENLEKIATTLQVIANVLSLLAQLTLVSLFAIIEKIASGIQTLFAKATAAGGGVQGIITAIVDTFVDFWTQLLEGNTFLNDFVNGALFIFQGLLKGIAGIVAAIIGLITGELSYDDLFSTGIGEAAKGFTKVLESLHLDRMLANFITWLKDFGTELVAADGIIAKFINNLVIGLNLLIDTFSRILNQVGIDDIKDLLLIAILWQFVTGLNKLNLTLNTAVGNIGTTFKNFNDIVAKLTDTARPTLDKLNTMFQRTTMLQIGIAVTLLVAALGQLNEMDWEKTQYSVAALGVSLAMLLAAFKVFQKIASAMPQKSESEKDNLSKALDSLGKNLLFLSAGSLMIAQTLKVLDETLFTEWGDFDWPKVISLFGSLAAIITGLVLAVNFMSASNVGKAADSIAAMFGLAVAIRIIAGAFAVLSRYSDGTLIAGGAALSVILLSIGGAVGIMSNINWKTAIATIPLVLTFSLGMTVLTGAIAMLAALVDGGKIAAALGVFVINVILMTGSLLTLGLALKTTPATTLAAISAAMLSFATSFVILGAALKIVEGYNWDASGKGVAALAVGFVEMSVALGALGRLLKDVPASTIKSIGFAFLELAGSVVVMAAGFKLLDTIDWQSIKTMVFTIGGIMAAFSLLAGALAGVAVYFDPSGTLFLKLAEGIDLLGHAFLNLGLGLLSAAAAFTAISAAIFIFSAASAVFATIIGAAQALGEKLGLDLPDMISTGFDTLELIIREFLEMLRNLAPDFLITFTALFATIAIAMEAARHPTAAAIISIFLTMADTIVDRADDIIQALIKLAQIVSSSTELFAALTDLVGAVFEWLGTALVVGLCSAIWGAIKALPTCIGIHMENAKQDISNSFNDELYDAISTVNDSSVDAATKKHAQATIESIMDAYEEDSSVLDESMAAMGQEALENFGNAAKIGAYTSMLGIPGMIKLGADTIADQVYDAGYGLGTKQKEGFEDSQDPDKPMDIYQYLTELIGPYIAAGIENIAPGVYTLMEDFGLGTAGSFADGYFGGLTKLLSGGTEKAVAKSSYEMMMEQREGLVSGTQDVVEEVEEETDDDWKNLGQNWMENLSSGISSGTSGAASKAKSAAEEIADSFAEGLETINRKKNTADLLYQLWKANNPNADELELAAKDIEYQTQQVQIQVEKASISQQIYQQTLEAMGSSAKETHEAFNDMLQDQIDLLEMQNKLAEAQMETADSSHEAWERYRQVIYDDWGQTLENGLTVFESLKQMGFSDAELAAAAAKQAGYEIPKAMDEAKEVVADASSAAGADAASIFAQTVNQQIANDATLFYEAGGSYVTQMADGARANISTLSTAVNDVNNNALMRANSEEVFLAWQDAGQNVDNGMISGINNLSEDVSISAVDMANASLEATKEALEINSPSGKFEYVGEMIDEGVIQGINTGAPKIAAAAREAALKAYQAALSALGIASPSKLMTEVGMYYDLGLAKGILGYSNTVERSATGMVKSLSNITAEKLSDANENAKRYLQETFGLNDDDISINVVFNADTTKLDSAMSELEKARTVAYSVSQPITQGVTAGLSFGGMSDLTEAENYQAVQLQRLCDIAEGFMQSRYSYDEEGSDSGEVTNVSFVQNNYSPKAISRVDTYRDTQRQLNEFALKYNITKQ